MKALVKVGDVCNHACRFCHRGGAGRVDVPGARVDALIDRAAALGYRMVVLSGGEVTLRPELLAWARRAAARGLDLGLVTNASRLDRPLVDALVRHRLRYVHLSLHGGDAALHDDLCGVPSFGRVLEAIGALGGRGLELWVNCVVARPNLDRLRGVVDALAPHADASLKFSFVEPRGAAMEDFDGMVPSVTEGSARIADALRYARATLGAGRRLAHDGLPLCLLPGLDGLRGDLRSHGFSAMAEVGEEDLHPVDECNSVHPPACRGCALRGRCSGLFRGYHAHKGDGELRPETGRPRSNSFNYVYEGHLETSGDGCPVAEMGLAPWDTGRHLFVRNGRRVGRFRTDTQDFSDDEIADVKRRTGQVYLDASRADAPTDFARQLVKLRPADECARCPEATRCTGLHEPATENVFARDEARLLELLGALEGTVLDIGCGDGPYGGALEAAAQSGLTRYVGLEPDPERASRLRRRWPWASMTVGTAEMLPFTERRFDHVLVLRSWNHLADPALATHRLLGALRAGGTLTIVDNGAFGLARTRAHAAIAQRSAAALEHYRNDGAAEAHALVSGVAADLRLLERWDVGPDTSNQWLLRFRLPG